MKISIHFVIIVSLAIMGCSAPIPQRLDATWYFVTEKIGKSLYIGILNAGPNALGPSRLYLNAERFPETIENLRVGEIRYFRIVSYSPTTGPAEQDISKARAEFEKNWSPCRLPATAVLVDINDNEKKWEVQMVSTMPTSIPEAWGQNCGLSP